MKILKKIDPMCGETELTIRTWSEAEYQKIVRQFDNRINLETNKGLQVLKKSEILYVESLRNYLECHTATEHYTVRSPLYKMKNMLGDDFIQVSRSYLINFAHLTSVETDFINGMVARVGGKKVPISRNYLQEIYRKLEEEK